MTVIRKLPEEEFACASVAVHSTIVVPSGKLEPEAGLQTAGIVPSTASLPVAVNVTT